MISLVLRIDRDPSEQSRNHLEMVILGFACCTINLVMFYLISPPSSRHTKSAKDVEYLLMIILKLTTWLHTPLYTRSAPNGIYDFSMHEYLLCLFAHMILQMSLSNVGVAMLAITDTSTTTRWPYLVFLSAVYSSFGCI